MQDTALLDTRFYLALTLPFLLFLLLRGVWKKRQSKSLSCKVTFSRKRAFASTPTNAISYPGTPNGTSNGEAHNAPNLILELSEKSLSMNGSHREESERSPTSNLKLELSEHSLSARPHSPILSEELSLSGRHELAESSPTAATIFRSPEHRRWDADMALSDKMIRLLLGNRFAEAEAIAEFGMSQEPLPQSPRATGNANADRFRDTRGAFAMAYAIFHAARSALAMERDNLKEALPRLIEAEALISAIKEPWPASQLMRGICEVAIGLIHCVNHSFVTGGYHLLRAYSAMRTVKIRSLLEWEGMEHEAVRSIALFFLGVKALILSIMPPAATKWLPGFSNAGNRADGLKMLRQCVSEGSLFKPPAMDVLLAYHINRDAWERREEEYESDQAEIRWIIEESERLFGRQALVYAHKGTLLLCGFGRDPLAGAARMAEVAADPNIATMPLLHSVLLMEQCYFLLAAGDSAEAASRVRKAIEICREHGKRTGMGDMLGMAARILLAEGDEEGGRKVIAEARRLQNGEELAKKPGKKKKWRKPDQMSFEMMDVFDQLEGEALQREALHRLVPRMWMAITMAAFPPEEAKKFIARLQDVPESLKTDPFIVAMAELACAMVASSQYLSAHVHSAEAKELNKAARGHCEAALAHEAALRENTRAKNLALLAQIYFHLATSHLNDGRLLSAQAAHAKAVAQPKANKNAPGSAIGQYVQGLGLAQLDMRLKQRSEPPLTLASDGAAHEIEIEVAAGETIELEWKCEKGSAVMLPTFEAHTFDEQAAAAEDDTLCTGSYASPSGGRLKLSWRATTAASKWLGQAQGATVRYCYLRVSGTVLAL